MGKKLVIIIVLTLIGILAVGCLPSAKPTTTAPADSYQSQITKLETKIALQEERIVNLQTQVNELSAKLAILGAEAN